MVDCLQVAGGGGGDKKAAEPAAPAEGGGEGGDSGGAAAPQPAKSVLCFNSLPPPKKLRPPWLGCIVKVVDECLQAII